MTQDEANIEETRARARLLNAQAAEIEARNANAGTTPAK